MKYGTTTSVRHYLQLLNLLMNVGVLFSTTPLYVTLKREWRKKKLILKMCLLFGRRNYFLIAAFCIDKSETVCTSGMKHPNEGMRLDANKYGNNAVASLSVDFIQVCNSV